MIVCQKNMTNAFFPTSEFNKYMQISESTLRYKATFYAEFLKELPVLIKHSGKNTLIEFYFLEGTFVLENEGLTMVTDVTVLDQFYFNFVSLGDLVFY